MSESKAEGAVEKLAVPPQLRFDERGLVPVVVQNMASGDVLMLAWANAEALERSVETRQMHFWSRSRCCLWRKGETSGNVLHVAALHADCDRDTVLAMVRPQGPTCHTGNRTCFGDGTPSLAGVLEEVAAVVAERARTRPEGSYTTRLLEGAPDRALKKLGEEATEVLLAAKGESDERLAEEAADLLFHLIVVLHQRGLTPADALRVLAARRR